jgi:hypothetical protein
MDSNRNCTPRASEMKPAAFLLKLPPPRGSIIGVVVISLREMILLRSEMTNSRHHAERDDY